MTTNTIKTDNPGNTSRNYREMEAKWDLSESLMGGTRAMRKKGETYLPRDDKESDANYKSRLSRSFLLNGYRRTVNAMTGKVFAKPVLLKENVPAPVKVVTEDVDREGRNLHLFCEEVFNTAMQYGLSHILVDMPAETLSNPTLKDDQVRGKRPYWVHVPPRNLIGYKSEKQGATQVLTQIRIREETMEEDGDYGEKLVVRIREISRTEWVLHEQDAEGNYTEVMRGKMTLGEIPLVTYYTKRVGFQLADPPLDDLAWMNVAHWQSSSDQRQILHVARVPILFSSGLGEDADKLVIGPNRHIQGPENSEMKYVEHSGAAISSGRQDLIDLEDNMRLMGLELLMPLNGGGQTATAKSLDYADSNSPLQFMALGFQDAVNMALYYTAKWMNLSDGGNVKVNTDFGITLRDAADVQGLIQARIAGEISRETFWAELKRRNILSEDFDEKKEKSLVEEEEAEAQSRALEIASTKTTPAIKGTGVGNDKVPEGAPGGVPGVGSDVK